jgi:hypothetical protein
MLLLFSEEGPVTIFQLDKRTKHRQRNIYYLLGKLRELRY